MRVLAAEVIRLQRLVPALAWTPGTYGGWHLCCCILGRDIIVGRVTPGIGPWTGVFRASTQNPTEAWVGHDVATPEDARRAVIAALPEEWRPLVPELPDGRATCDQLHVQPTRA